jgi:hypothetical protein
MHSTFLNTVTKLNNKEGKEWRTEGLGMASRLPLARVKKIMKVGLLGNESAARGDDEKEEEVVGQEQQSSSSSSSITSDKIMISPEAPALLSIASALLIQELTLLAWSSTTIGNRRTVQRHDVCSGVCSSESYDFLIDLVPRVKYSHIMKPNTTGRANSLSGSEQAAAIVRGEEQDLLFQQQQRQMALEIQIQMRNILEMQRRREQQQDEVEGEESEEELGEGSSSSSSSSSNNNNKKRKKASTTKTTTTDDGGPTLERKGSSEVVDAWQSAATQALLGLENAGGGGGRTI